MKIIVISIGDEILAGHTLNRNLSFLGEHLVLSGLRVAKELCVPDDPAVLDATFAKALAEADLVITTGGLGPTRDDVTRDAACRVMGLTLAKDDAVYAEICSFLQKRGHCNPSLSAETQSMVPTGATVLANSNGTAPGLWCEAANGAALVMMPGPPREMQPMFLDEVLPRITDRWKPEMVLESVVLAGMPESMAARQVDRMAERFSGVGVAYCARPSGVDVRLSAPYALEALVHELANEVRSCFPDEALPGHCTTLVEHLTELLLEKSCTISVAESCTGGLLGEAFTARPGASAFFKGGVIAYSNDVKQAVLGVRESTLIEHGAVSEKTAEEMALGVMERVGTDVAIAITGVAGPGGGTPEKPVGTVCMATVVDGESRVTRQLFPGNRATVRERALAYSFNQLRNQLLKKAIDA